MLDQTTYKIFSKKRIDKKIFISYKKFSIEINSKVYTDNFKRFKNVPRIY